MDEIDVWKRKKPKYSKCRRVQQPQICGERRRSRRHGVHDEVKTADGAENKAGLKDSPDDAKLT